MKENSLWDAGKGSRISLDIEWSQKDHAAFFCKYMVTKYKCLVTRQKAKKGNPVHLTNRVKDQS